MMEIWKKLIIVGLALSLAACERGPNANELEAIKNMTNNMKTYCVGRYLIDLPNGFSWNKFPLVELYYGLGSDFATANVQIVDIDSNEEKFEKKISKRSNEIRSMKNEKTGGPMLILDRKTRKTERIIRYFDNELSTDFHKHEVHLLLSNNHIMITADSYDGVIEPVEDRIIKIASQIKEITGSLDEIGPGFCLGNILINADNDNEVLVSSTAHDIEKPDVFLEIYMDAISYDDEERLPDQLRRELSIFSTSPKILRSGTTKLGDMDADEALMRFNGDGIRNLAFVARSIRATPSFEQPSINLSMHTGGEISPPANPDFLRYKPNGALPHGPRSRTVSSSLTDQEAIGLWDTIRKSVRLRPNAVRPRQ